MSPSSSTPQDAFKRPPAAKREPQVGDVVRIGKGRVEYTITRFTTVGILPIAELVPTDGFGHATATLNRLTVLS